MTTNGRRHSILRLATMGFDPTFSTPDELAAHMRAETDKWSKVVRQANLKIE